METEEHDAPKRANEYMEFLRNADDIGEAEMSVIMEMILNPH